MWLCGVLFLLIGLGSLAVAAVPGVDDWVAEQTVDAAGAPNAFDDEVVTAIADSEGVRTTSWILAATFLPTALLFFWCGRWFKSMQPSFNSLMQTSAQLSRNGNAMFQQQFPQGTAVPGSGVITTGTPASTAAAPPWTGIKSDPVVEPPDPTAGGIIS